MSNSAIITLACPACGRAFMTLSEGRGGDEICPHCTKALPRAAFKTSATLTMATSHPAVVKAPAPALFVAPEKQMPLPVKAVRAATASTSPPAPISQEQLPQPRILEGTPIAAFVASQETPGAEPPPSVVPVQLEPVTRPVAVVEIPPAVAVQPAPEPEKAAAQPVWPGLGVEDDLALEEVSPFSEAAAHQADKVEPSRSIASPLAILLTLIIAGEVAWVVFRGPYARFVHPVTQEQVAAPVDQPVKALPELVPLPEEIRKAEPASQGQSPSEVSSR